MTHCMVVHHHHHNVNNCSKRDVCHVRYVVRYYVMDMTRLKTGLKAFSRSEFVVVLVRGR